MAVKNLVLIYIGGALLLLLIVALIEPFLIRPSYLRWPQERQRLEASRSKRNLFCRRFNADAQPRRRGEIRVLFFSDLHINNLFYPHNRLITRFLEPMPDLIIFGGDLISRERDKSKGLAFLRELVLAAAKKSVPVIMVPGNHDGFFLPREITDTGALFADNRSLRLRLSDANCTAGKQALSWDLIGLQDLRRGRPDFNEACRQKLFLQFNPLNLLFKGSRLCFSAAGPIADGASQSSETTSPDVLPAADGGPARQSRNPRGLIKKLIIGHNPDTILTLQTATDDLFLSGHFHGGQIRLPFRLEFKMLRSDTLCRKGYYHGLFQIDKKSGFISRGIGCVLFPLRLFARPEFTVIDLAGQE